MEIEKKFQVLLIPEHLEIYEKKEIEQGYLCKKPVVRIRKSNEEYILTYKSRIGMNNGSMSALTCEEIEMPLSKDAYEHLKEKVDYNIIKKTRYLIPLEDDLMAELDIFKDSLEGLYFVEVEFESEEAAELFQPPEWFGKDVTYEKKYRNSFLAKLNSYEEFLS